VEAFIEYSLLFKPGLHIYNYIDKPDFDMNTLISGTRKTLFGKTNVGLSATWIYWFSLWAMLLTWRQ
jgi:hypothetical protein